MKLSSITNVGNKIFQFCGFMIVVFAVTAVTQHKLDILKATNEVARQGFVSAEDRTRQLACLTKNIYWESASEPFEGKVAVAQVTINSLSVLLVLRWFQQDPTHIPSTLERIRRGSKKGPVGRF